MASGIGLPGLREKNGYRLKVFLNQFVSDEEMIFLDKSGGKGEWRRIAKLELYDLKRQKTVAYTPSTASRSYRRIHDAIMQEINGEYLLDKDQIKIYSQVIGNNSKGRIESSDIPFTRLAKTEVFGGKFSMEAKDLGGGGVSTENASEVLSMYCLAYYITYSKPITKETFCAGNDLDQNVMKVVKKKCHIPGNIFKFSDQKNRIALVAFAIKPKGLKVGNYTWLDCCIAQSKAIMTSRHTSIDSSFHVFNDKFFGTGTKPMDPYKAYAKSGNTAGEDKWNPADMWVMNTAGITAITKFNRSQNSPSVITLNEFLVKQWDESQIYPISLKKLNPASPHFVKMNSNEYVERISINDQRNPVVVEFNDNRSNRDVKINFALETIKLNPGMTAERAQKNLYGNIGTVVADPPPKKIRIKFKVSTRGMELEYNQTGGDKYSEAKMGALGYIEYNKIISDTSTQGIRELNKLKSKYDDTDIVLNKSFDPFTSHALKLGKTNSARAKLYLDDLWTTINNDPYNSDYLVKNSTYLKDKIIAGEIGVSIHKIRNKKIKQQVIQNLYNACASVGIIGGVVAGNDKEMLAAVGSGLSKTQRISFLGGIHGKVY